MRQELIVQEEKPSTIKKIIVGIIIGLVIIGFMVAGIAVQIFQETSPSSSTSPYVEVDYKLSDWYNSTLSGPTTYTVDFNVTIMNRGYSDAVQNPDFSLTVNNVVYYGHDFLGSFSNVLIESSGKVSGKITFIDMPVAQAPFTFGCKLDFVSNLSSTPQVELVQK
jgi:hypothetical protein